MAPPGIVIDMKIRVADVGEEEKSLEFREPLGELNALLRARAAVDFEFVRDAAVDLRHYRAGTDLFFGGRIEAESSGTCARCLERFPAPIDRDFQWVLKPRSKESGDVEGVAGSALAFYEGDEVDLAPLVREEILVALPTRALCKEDCAGLCAHCGSNRNLRDCGCTEERGDPRLAVLRDWKPTPRE